jgi:hypothetical protein
VTAEEASRPVSASCASIAAQVNHTTYYLDVLGHELRGQEVGKVDWNGAWTIGPVNVSEWAALVERFRATAEATLVTIRTMPEWREDPAWAAAAIAVHTAYHLGEIRQALCTIRPNRS